MTLSARHAALFATLHAFATLFRTEYGHLLNNGDAGERALVLPLTAAALAVLWSPGSSLRLVALLVAQLAHVAYTHPEVPNHWLLTALVNVTLLGCFGVVAAQQRAVPALAAWVGPAVRPLLVGVAVFYWFTGLWKLNTDFLRPDVSCGMAAWQRLAALVPLVGGASVLAPVTIWGTLVLEWVGPVLLLVPRARLLTAAAFVLFHALLGVDLVQRFLNFSSVMFALLVLYAPSPAVDAALDRFDLNRLGRLFTPVFFVIWAVAVGVLARGDSPVLPYWTARWLVWLAFAALVVALWCFIALAPRVSWRTPPALPLAWAFVGLVVLNGLSPWLGLKNRSSWQMYSNVRLEPSASNHLVFPRSLDLLGVMGDAATVHAISDVRLASEWVGDGVTVPWLQLRRDSWLVPDASITYTYAGERRQVENIGEDKVLGRPLPWWQRKLVWFRPLGARVGEQCQW